MPLRCASPSEKLPPSPDPPDRQPVFCPRQLSRTTRTPRTQNTLPHTATGESSTSSRRSDGKSFVRGGGRAVNRVCMCVIPEGDLSSGFIGCSDPRRVFSAVRYELFQKQLPRAWLAS